MASLMIPEMYGWGNVFPLLPKAMQFFHDTLCAPCAHGSVKTLLCRRLQIVDQLQHATTSPPRVMPFSALSAVGMLPPPVMEQEWGGGADLGSQRTRPRPSHPCLPPCRRERAKGLVNPRENRALHGPDRCQAPVDHLRLMGRGEDAFLGRLSPASGLSSDLVQKPPRCITGKCPDL
jgi:hypothetical protein